MIFVRNGISVCLLLYVTVALKQKPFTELLKLGLRRLRDSLHKLSLLTGMAKAAQSAGFTFVIQMPPRRSVACNCHPQQNSFVLEERGVGWLRFLLIPLLSAVANFPCSSLSGPSFESQVMGWTAPSLASSVSSSRLNQG